METALLYGDSPDGGESPDVLVVERVPLVLVEREVLVVERVPLVLVEREVLVKREVLVRSWSGKKKFSGWGHCLI